MSPAVLALRAITKQFGGVVANRGVTLEVARGTIHAVVGENGAGKSTLLKIAYGEVAADAGEIELKGERIALARHRPLEAMRRGVGMVHQHFMLVGPMTVVDNVMLGRERSRRGLLDRATVAAELRALAARFGLEVDPTAPVESLAVGQQQRVEILKVLWQGCDVLILDEPTAVLAPHEVRQLFAVLGRLVGEGMTVVLISHKLDEVCAVAQRITVLRRGEVVAELDGAGASPAAIAHAMVGREVLLKVDRAPARPGAPRLEVSELVVAGERGGRAVDRVSLAVHAGEIVGVAGIEGNGQSELFEAIVGLRRVQAGRIALAGRELARAGVAARHAAGLAHIPEDRHARGLVLDFSIADNLVLGRLGEYRGRLGLDRRAIAANAAREIARADIRPADPAAPARALSGGNQQKIVVARELGRPGASVLVAVQPTRGVDIGAIEHIHRALVAARDRGLAILLGSADLAELTALADRVLVLCRGRVVAELGPAELAAPDAHDRIGEHMAGVAASVAS